jgi:hypothetical protein
VYRVGESEQRAVVLVGGIEAKIGAAQSREERGDRIFGEEIRAMGLA